MYVFVTGGKGRSKRTIFFKIKISKCIIVYDDYGNKRDEKPPSNWVFNSGVAFDENFKRVCWCLIGPLYLRMQSTHVKSCGVLSWANSFSFHVNLKTLERNTSNQIVPFKIPLHWEIFVEDLFTCILFKCKAKKIANRNISF